MIVIMIFCRRFLLIVALSIWVVGCGVVTPMPHATNMAGHAGVVDTAQVIEPTSSTRNDLRTNAPTVPTLVPALISQGSKIYSQHCASCHGVQLQGQANWQTPMPNVVLAPPLDHSGHAWQHTDRELQAQIRNGMNLKDANGVPFSPPFASLLDGNEINAVIVFIKSRWTQTQRQQQWNLTNRIQTQNLPTPTAVNKPIQK
jgi:mono/diheme cytochrome c family protein